MVWDKLRRCKWMCCQWTREPREPWEPIDSSPARASTIRRRRPAARFGPGGYIITVERACDRTRALCEAHLQPELGRQGLARLQVDRGAGSARRGIGVRVCCSRWGRWGEEKGEGKRGVESLPPAPALPISPDPASCFRFQPSLLFLPRMAPAMYASSRRPTACAGMTGAAARAGKYRFWLLTALHAHIKTPPREYLRRRTRRPRERRGGARTGTLELDGPGATYCGGL